MGYKIGSAGAMGVTGWPASAEAVTICRTNGIDIASHSSSALTGELIDASDLIFVMSDSHRKQVLQLSPGSAEKCLLLAGDEEIPDPIGQNEKIYEDCFVMIENAITKRISELKL
jgi:protein-tyrosine-phosphatase